MAINFPPITVTGQTYDYQGIRYTADFTVAPGFWQITTPGTFGVASSAEVDAGTDAVKYVSPAALEGSKYNDVQASDVDYDDSASSIGINVQAGMELLALRANPNMLINGGMDMWQRGTSFTGASNAYCADRWLKGGDSTVTRSTDVPSSEFNYSARVDRVGNVSQLRGSVELSKAGSAAPFDINGNYTFSAWVRAEAAANIQLHIFYADGVSSGANPVIVLPNQTLGAVTTGWTKVSITVPMGAILPAATNKALNFVLMMNTSDVFFKITGIKFEKGSVATPYQPRPISEELALCQRYYQIKGIYSTFRAEVNVTLRWSTDFMTQMRTIPSVTLNMINDGGGATSAGYVRDNTVELQFVTGGGGTYTKRGTAILSSEL